MLATPADALPDDDEQWAYEMAWDGVRAAVHVEGGRATAWSRHDRELTAAFPEVRAMAESMERRKPCWTVCWWHSTPRRRARAAAAADAGLWRREGPATGRIGAGHLPGLRRAAPRRPVDVVGALPERRERLDELGLSGPSWRTPPAWFGGGAAVLVTAHEQHLTGVVAKQLESPYQPGVQSGSWLEVTAHPR